MSYNRRVDSKTLQSLILLTYKSKALLLHRNLSPIDQGQHGWSFIGVNKGENESSEEAISRQVEGEMSIKIKAIQILSKYCFHARLSDNDVNNIKREEGQLLNFFTLRELQKLQLTPSTRQFVTTFGSLIESLSI